MSSERPRLLLSRIVLDVTDVDRAMKFWCAALGYVEAFRDEHFAVAKDPQGKRVPMGFQPVKESKYGVSPLHFELFTDDMEREAKRLEKLGATRVADWPYPDPDHNWIVMRDPDGHELCVCQFPTERLSF